MDQAQGAHRRRWVGVLGALAAAALVVAACGGGGSGTAGDGEGLRIVTTVSPITNIVANIAGGVATIEGLVPEGVNSHTFEPPAAAAAAVAGADVVFVNGLGLEEPIMDLARTNLPPGAPMVELAGEAISPDEHIYDFSFPPEGGRPNPHLWTSPRLGLAYARIVTDTLAGLDPSRADLYRERLDAFGARVEAFDTALREATATVPEGNRRLLTYHDSFPYFARDYGWEIIGAIQPSSFDEPTPREVAAIIDQIRATGVPAIFGSEVFPSPVLEQIGRETGVRYVDTLRDDDLPGGPGDPEHTWLGLLREDFVTIVEALGGDASALRAVDVSNVAPDDARYPQ